MSRPLQNDSITLEEYEALPDDERYIDEVSHGRLVREPRPGSRHGQIVSTLTFDLAIEVVSPSNRSGELLQKIGEFLEAGTQLAWIVYPTPRTVAEYSADAEPRIYGAEDMLAAPLLLPGFELKVERIFQ